MYCVALWKAPGPLGGIDIRRGKVIYYWKDSEIWVLSKAVDKALKVEKGLV